MPKKITATQSQGRDFAQIRLSGHAAAMEFSINKETFLKRAKQLGVLPGEDNKWSISDAAKVKFTSYEVERSRKMKADADISEHTARELQGELIQRQAVMDFCEGLAVIIRQKILGSTMPDNEKDEILKETSNLLDEGIITKRTCSPKCGVGAGQDIPASTKAKD